MRRLFEIEIQSAQVPELRLCMAADSRSTISGHMNLAYLLSQLLELSLRRS
jgi:hypothetical protein